LSSIFNPNYALEAKRANALVGFNPDLATLGFHQKVSCDFVKTIVLLSRYKAEKMLLHFLDLTSQGTGIGKCYPLS